MIRLALIWLTFRYSEILLLQLWRAAMRRLPQGWDVFRNLF
jgi:hypothetical protein